MIQTLYGTDDVLLRKYLLKEIKSDDNTFSFDTLKDEQASILESLLYEDLFSTSKSIIINNAQELISKDIPLDKYLINMSSSINLYLVFNIDKLDERSKTVKYLLEHSKVIVFNKLNSKNINSYITSSFISDGYKIDYDALNYLSLTYIDNTSLIYGEIDKLKIYKSDTKHISLEDVKNVISPMPSNDIFKLTDALSKRNKDLIFKCYKNLINNKVDENSIVSLLASNFRLMFQIKLLMQEKVSPNEISTILKVHPYRVTVIQKTINTFTINDLEKILLDLSDVDKKIKTTDAPINTYLELFLLNF